MTTDSKCGTCQMCCRILEVRTLEKPVDTRCLHQCLAGCGIYQEKPSECSTYECLWLQSQGDNVLDPFPETWRPDRLGIVIDGGGLDPERRVLVFRTTSTGESRLKSVDARTIAQSLVRQGFTIAVKIGSREPITWQDFLRRS
jgi:hypothetical protein